MDFNHTHNQKHNQDLAEIFRRHYEDGNSNWGKSSGPGSSPYSTIQYRSFIENFIRMNNIEKVVDVGCGDWQFSRFINFDGVDYLGFDIVSSVVEKNNVNFRTNKINFRMMPSDIEDIQSADLLIMKDVLQHLSNQEILQFKNKVFQKFKYCLLTNSYRKLNVKTNIDIKDGGFRCLDLSLPPFSFNGSYLLEFFTFEWELVRVFLLKS